MNLKSTFSSGAVDLVLVGEDGRLMVWKNPTSGPSRLPKPKYLDFPTALKSFACGPCHFLALTVDDKVLGWGDTRKYQLGTTRGVTATGFLEILISDKIISVHTFADAVYALAEGGRVWAWGDNSQGQCGLDPRTVGLVVTTPTLVPQFSPFPVVDLAASSIHVIALTEDGTVWTWGSNGHGRLGVSEFQHHLTYIPQQVPLILTDVVRVYATFGNSLVLTKSGALYIWGCNTYQILGNGTTNDSYRPHLIFPSGVQEVACGSAHVLVLLEDESLCSWGLNVAGQTGFPGKGIIPKPRAVDITAIDGKISGMIAGDHFSVLITDSGEFYLSGFFIHQNGDFGKYPEFKVKVPRNSSKLLWERLFMFIFLGNRDNVSIFFSFPIEVIFHFVSVMSR
jgi:alpha-tubulin suppressor-like RCC1 family protein